MAGGKKRKPVDYESGSISGVSPTKPAKKYAKAEMEVGTASKCLEEIARYDKQYERWSKRTKEIIDRFRDERDQSNTGSRAFNILWSNIQVLKPTLYARVPKAEVVRRFKDQDKVARIGAEITERAADVEIESTGLDHVLQCCVDDRLLGGRGQAWVCYDPEFKGDEDDKVKTDEGLCVEYVDWRDFGHSPVPTWPQVTKVWRWKYFNKDAFKSRFGEKWIDQVEFAERKSNDKNEPENLPEARVAEVWDKETRKVYWVSKAVPDYLDEYEDPLNLEKFFPCPKPLYATTTNNTLVPVPDFYLYQDQANEVDKLTGRINRLTDALKIVGVYDQNVKQLQDIMSPSGTPDNSLVAVDMNDLTGKGGLRQAVQLVDITQVIQCIQECYIAREAAIQAIYQISGISDILRGATDPRETKGAQDLKAQFGGTRIRKMQQDVAEFSRDIIRIMAELIVEMYEPMKLWAMTNAVSFVGNAPQPPAQPGAPPPAPQPNVDLFAKALKLLKSDKLRSYRVDIETDSTIALDEAQSKQEAQEFVTAVGGFIKEALPVVQASPAMAPVIGEVLMFLVRRNKGGRTLEGTIEEAVSQLVEQSKQPPPPSPEMIKAQGEQQKIQAQVQAQQQKAQIDAAVAQQKMAMEERMAQMEMQLKQMEIAMKAEEHKQELQAKAQEHVQNMIHASEKADLDTQLAAQQGQVKIAQTEALGAAKVAQAQQLAKTRPVGRA